MAEKLYFIKVNPIVAKINLYNKLCRQEDQVLEFLEEDKKTSLELIRKKVKENIESLSQEELLNIFDWFNAEYPSDREEMKTQLFIHGIDLFYEITSPHIEQLRHILTDYEKHARTIINHVIDSETFNHFLIYGILFTALMSKRTEEEDYLFSSLKSQYKDIYLFAENEYQAKSSEQFLYSDTYDHFKELFDVTKFYKGSVIRLHHNS